MRVLLVDLDRTGFPNLALMKLSAWHKRLGHTVYLNEPIQGYDHVEASCVFSWNLKKQTRYPTPHHAGGRAFSLHDDLPHDVDHIMPDYSLYGTDYSLGVTSRGCPNRCPWCEEWRNTPYTVPHARIFEFWDRRHSHIKLLDANLLASPGVFTTLQDLAASPVTVDFNQALDIRFVDADVAHALSAVTVKPCLRFSFDSSPVDESVRRGVSALVKRGFRASQLNFYVMVGFGESFAQESYRLKLLKELGCQAHIMFYRDREGREHLPAEGSITEEELPRGSRWTIRKYVRRAGRRSR